MKEKSPIEKERKGKTRVKELKSEKNTGSGKKRREGQSFLFNSFRYKGGIKTKNRSSMS